MEKKKTEQAQGAETVQDEQQQRKKRRGHAFRLFLIKLILLVAAVYVLLFHIVGFTVMPRADMEPRMEAGDLLLFNRLDRAPKAQDIVVIDKAVLEDYSADESEAAKNPGFLGKALKWIGFNDPNAPTQRFVCRVVAGPGDTVEITEEHGLTVNGQPVTETDIDGTTLPYDGYITYPVTLGDGAYFVLSDSRNGGVDSRIFGPVTRDEIQGIVITMLRRSNL